MGQQGKRPQGLAALAPGDQDLALAVDRKELDHPPPVRWDRTVAAGGAADRAHRPDAGAHVEAIRPDGLCVFPDRREVITVDELDVCSTLASGTGDPRVPPAGPHLFMRSQSALCFSSPVRTAR